MECVSVYYSPQYRRHTAVRKKDEGWIHRRWQDGQGSVSRIYINRYLLHELQNVEQY